MTQKTIQISILLILFVGSFSTIYAQGIWTWKWGSPTSQTINSVGQGIFSPLNFPESRYAGMYWTDNNGGFWRYGGGGADLWKYDKNLNQWALMNGPLTPSLPVFGTQGVANVANNPGTGQYGGPSWTDKNGNLWLYGLQSSNDLWQYNTTSNQWTWMHGSGTSTPAVFGTQGVANSANHPGIVNETNCKWVDSNNNLWLFNDLNGVLWKYSIANNMWTWMKGTPNSFTPNYGTLGNFSATNVPSAYSACPSVGAFFNMWQDSSDHFYFLLNRDIGVSVLAEIWKYSIALNQWACMRIDTTGFGDPQTWTTPCIESPTIAPVARTEMRANWVDACDNVWIFGGGNFCNLGVSIYNDMWRYNPSTNNWTWIKGSNSPANFGTINVPNSNSIPRASYGQQTYTDSEGFWMTGGQNNVGDPIHHVWMYKPDTVDANFTFTNNCLNANFTNTSTTGCNYIKSVYWNFGDSASGINNTTTVNNPTHVFSTTGVFQVMLVVKNCTWDADTFIQNINIAGFSLSTTTTPTNCTAPTGSATATPTGGASPYTYLWQPGGQTTATISNIGIGTYTVNITDANSCSQSSIVNIISNNGPVLSTTQSNINCNGICNGSATTTTTTGTAPYSFLWSNGDTTANVSNLCAGIYSITVTDINSCSSFSIVNITQPSAISLSTSMQVNCATAGTATVTANGGTPTYNYQWLPSGGTSSSANNLATNIYTVIVTDANLCTQSTSINIIVPNAPTLTTTSTNVLCNSACTGSVNVAASNGTAPYNYTWSNGNNTNAATNLCAGSYTITITDANACTTQQVITITQPNALNINTTTTASGCTVATGSAIADLSGGVMPYQYTWSNGTQNDSVNNLATGSYTVTITDANNCTKTSVINIGTTNSPIVSALASPNASIILGDTILLQANGALNYVWYPNYNLSCNTCATTFANPFQNTLYCAVGTDSLGCEDSACVQINVNIICPEPFIPNAFSPNGDGTNDKLGVISNCLQSFTFSIYNRFGEQVFITKDISEKWDGTFKEQYAELGVYYYYLTGKMITGQEIKKKGDISLIR